MIAKYMQSDRVPTALELEGELRLGLEGKPQKRGAISPVAASITARADTGDRDLQQTFLIMM